MTEKNYQWVVRLKDKEQKAIFAEKLSRDNDWITVECRTKDGKAYERQIARTEIAEITRDLPENDSKTE